MVKTTNFWEGWITLGIAYESKDVPKNLCQFDAEEQYIYVQPLNGRIINSSNRNLTMLDGYHTNNLIVISSNTEQL